MSLEILKIINGSTPETEYVRLCAIENVNLHDYGIVDKTFSDKGVSNIYRHFYRFPDKQVKKNEFIRLYTCTGIYKKEVNANKATVHHFYWGSEECIWNDSETDEAVLLKIAVIGSQKAH